MRLIVGLELNARDNTILKFVKNLSVQATLEQLSFVNIHQPLSLPEAILEQFPEVKESVNDVFIKELVEESHRFKFFGSEVNYRALEGDVLKEFLKLSKDSKTEYIVLGKNSGNGNEKLSLTKFVRKSLANILIVGKQTPTEVNNILVAVDFSRNSALAVKEALMLAEVYGASVSCLHAYSVPVGYYKTGKSFAEFAEIMKSNASAEYFTFIKKYDFDSSFLKPVFELSEGDAAFTTIQYVNKPKTDMLVLGAKGRSNLASVLLGSITEEVVTSEIEIPIVVCKDRTSDFDFWDALSEL